MHGLPAKCVGYMGLVWADGRNNTHNLAIMGRFFLQSGSVKHCKLYFCLECMYFERYHNYIYY